MQAVETLWSAILCCVQIFDFLSRKAASQTFRHNKFKFLYIIPPGVLEQHSGPCSKRQLGPFLFSGASQAVGHPRQLESKHWLMSTNLKADILLSWNGVPSTIIGMLSSLFPVPNYLVFLITHSAPDPFSILRFSASCVVVSSLTHT